MPVPSLSDFPPIASSTTVTIANGAALSGAADLLGNSLVGVQMPSTWTAASLSFDVSIDGSTYTALYIVNSSMAATEYAITSPAASYGISLDPAIFAGWRFVKVRSGTSGSPVNQGGARTMTLVVRPV